MNTRRLSTLALLSSALLLSACGNKGPLLPPPAPADEAWLEDDEPDDGIDAGVEEDVEDVEDIEDGVDGEGEDPAPADAGEDGDGGA